MYKKRKTDKSRLKRKKPAEHQILIGIVLAWLISILLIYLLTPLPLADLKDYSKTVLAQDGSILRVFLNSNQQWCLPQIDKNRIPAKLKTAVLAYEDRYFYAHPGFNPAALLRAFLLNLRAGRIVSGGSTITMQVARLADPKPRTVISKLLEIFQALKLEIRSNKENILNLYLNHAPYGGNIRGVRAASLKYFGKEPLQLSWSEVCILAVLPNSPGLITPARRKTLLLQKRDRLLKELHDQKVIDRDTYEISLREQVPDRILPFPWLAPHLTRRLADRTEEVVIATTIDLSLQTRVEEIIKQHSKYLQYQGIGNISCLVVGNETGKIRSYCGSQDFNDVLYQGQVDGVNAPRSPGSILKPFLYALSIDDGLIIPATMMQDIPTYFGPFQPVNATGKFDGLVTARSALVRSLNVPAVRLLNLYGIDPFYNFLRSAGAETLFRTPDEYGLTLIIGGCEMTLYDVVKLYRGLANYGRFSSLRIMESDEEKNDIRLISPGACYMILDVLKDLNRPGSEYYWHQYENQYPLAWKTGTSFGQRDAWAVGVNPEWTIGVWAGNFDGEVNPDLSGASSAGPILFDIFNILTHETEKTWFDPPLDEMEPVRICKDTGFLAGPDCPGTDIIMVPESTHGLRLCPYHHTIYLNDEGTEQVCSSCWDPNHYQTGKFLVYPPAILDHLRERGEWSNQLPPHNPDCPALDENNPLRIIYPLNSALIWLPRDIGGRQQKITLKAAHSYPGMKIFWYLDEHYLGTTESDHSMAIAPDRGKHSLKVIDRNGSWSRIEFEVDHH